MGKLKEIYEGVLFIAFLAIAVMGVGNADDGSEVFLSASAMVMVGVLMWRAGMMSGADNDEEDNF